jgi:hypothetical protein
MFPNLTKKSDGAFYMLACSALVYPVVQAKRINPEVTVYRQCKVISGISKWTVKLK